jgi:hypothetical protein
VQYEEPEDLLATFDPERHYSAAQLREITDAYLKRDARSIDAETGKPRGIKGENPILFEEHLKSRRRREIQTEGGTPDPALVSGMYYRSHPQGRKVNSLAQRRESGASYYRN